MHSHQRDITIQDLAGRLALSVATVSRALNDDHSVKPQTRKRVLEMADQLGYRMNVHARMLRNGRSSTIGCIVPRLDNYFISTVLSGIEDAANREGYSLVVMQSHASEQTEIHCANALFDKRIDGLIVLLSNETAELDHFDAFLKKHIPVILLDHAWNDPAFVNIFIDNRNAGYEVTRHLLSRGCRRIVHLTSDSPADVDRCKGYRKALIEAGLRVKEQYIIKGGLGWEGGTAAVAAIGQWKQMPDAIFAASDLCAAGCMMALREKGFNIPQEIAVAGFGNDPVSQVTAPSLTTVGLPGAQMGEAAVTQLISRLQGMPATNTVVLRSELIIRRSTVIEKPC